MTLPIDRERAREAKRRWRAANPEKQRKQARAYYEANRERILATNARWQQANPEKLREYWRRRSGRRIPDHEAFITKEAEPLRAKRRPLECDGSEQCWVTIGRAGLKFKSLHGVAPRCGACDGKILF